MQIFHGSEKIIQTPLRKIEFHLLFFFTINVVVYLL